jgi:hypothetical protein
MEAINKKGELGSAILEAHERKAAIADTFCRGEGFNWYSESKTRFVFTCKGGGNFSLAK